MSAQEESGLQSGPAQAQGKQPRFVVINDTKEKEDAFDLVQKRNLDRPIGLNGTIAYIFKGAVGTGILGIHCGWAACGTIALPLTCLIGIYMCFCLHLLVTTAQTIYKRTEVCQRMSYSDVGEAALAISESPKVRKLSKPFRYCIDVIVCLNTLGGCCCNQLMIAKTIKQVVENEQESSAAALKPGYPNLKLYLLMISVPMICICLVKQLDMIAKMSLVGNLLVLLLIIITVYYSLKINPSMKGMKFFTSIKGMFILTAQTGFSMSCSSILIPIECNMEKPSKFPLALWITFFIITVAVLTMGLFGYSAYGEASKSPVMVHFPLALLPTVLKLSIALMLVISHVLNFWSLFNLIFRYLQKLHSESKRNCVEYIYRALLCFLCTCISIVFPSVNRLMGFLGSFCLCNLAFIFPALIWLTVHWRRPGLGTAYFRLFVCVILVATGVILLCGGTYVYSGELIAVFGASDAKIDNFDYQDTHEDNNFDFHDIIES